MGAASGKLVSTVGFLSVIEHENFGLFGGLLLLNAAGRPVEFHCTAPLKPSRAQQIFYGPTLEPYLYGEQIGVSLLNKVQSAPPVVLTDVAGVLAVRDFVDLPVALVARGQLAHRGTRFQFGEHELSVETTRFEDQALVLSLLRVLPESFDLLEPFGRIHDAIQEAQRVGRAA
ncbi:MAG TPA: hypothetical protein VFE24_16770 [Pirellulales bacterium]|nr:hypothetical protein [Pirellulales bacterium]